MAVELSGVSKRYGAVEVLPPLTLRVEPGEFLTLLGPSGSGKTTVLKLLGGFTAPSAGAILLDGRDITRLPPNLRPFNTVFQDYALFPHMTVAANVGYGPRVQRRPRAEAAARVDEVIEVVGLGPFRDRYPDELSGGQKQRVALARAIVCEPALILLDEPLSALDAGLRKQMQVFLKQIQRRIRTTFVFVTHDQEEALALSDRVVVMRAGRVEQVGTPQDVYFRPRTRFVAGFIGENNLLPGEARGGEVATPLGRLPAAGAGSGGEGAGVLAIRPEALRLARPDAALAPHPAIPAEVAEVTFAGATLRVAARALAAPDLLLVLHLPVDPRAAPPEPGARVTLRYDPGAAVFVHGA